MGQVRHGSAATTHAIPSQTGPETEPAGFRISLPDLHVPPASLKAGSP